MVSALAARLTYANVVATVAVLIAVGGSGYAVGAMSAANGLIMACAAKSGQLMLAHHGKCAKKQQTVMWNARGPQGQVGSQGVQGSKGDKGDPGTPAPSYTAGSGLTLASNSFSANPTFVQRRISSTCPAGNAIQAIGQDGTVTCQATGFTHITERVASGASPQVATCNLGEVVFGGGAYAYTGQLTGSYAYQNGGTNGWQAYATSGTVQARALCASP